MKLSFFTFEVMMTTLPGYVLLLKDAEDVTGKLAEQLGYAGISVTLSKDQDSCALSVPREQEARARALLAEYFTASSRERKDEDLENFHGSFLQKTPVFMSSRDRLRNRTYALGFHFAVSAFLLIQSVSAFARGDGVQGAFWGVPCLIFLFLGLHTLRKLRELKRSAREEEAFTAKILDWFGRTYTAAGIDRMVLSAAPSQDEAELDILRLDCVRDYVRREFLIEDEAYLEYVTDRIFKSLYRQEG